MRRTLNASFFIFLIAGQFFCSNKNLTNAVADAGPIAFPSAEGFGKFTTGGRNGSVYKVTNLEDDGEGSLRWALSKKGPRIVVFDVSGTIHLKSPLNVKANTTLAGHSAPGDGICIADHPVKVDGDNVIIRYMRFRLGDRYQNLGMVNGSGHDDAMSANDKKNVIIDHCSLSWSNDEVLSAYNGDSVTLQWNIISEPLNYSYHFETGDKDWERHGYGGIWGGRHFSAHHNLFAHCVSRNPQFAGIRSIDSELVDYRNNVIYNWGHNNVYGGEGGQYNLVNNYYKYGPSTSNGVKYRIVNPSRSEEVGFGKYYVAGNYVDGSSDITLNNSGGIHVQKGGSLEDVIVAQPFGVVEVPIQTAQQAYAQVLAAAGASYRRDTLDQRIINQVSRREGGIIDVQGGYPHGTEYAKTVSAWPTLATAPAAPDADGDGMPDEWEKRQGLNPDNPADATITTLHSDHNNIEVYLNSLLK